MDNNPVYGTYLAPSICTLADLILLEEGTFSIRFDPLPFSSGLPRIPLDI